jgi:hypothetical protein
MEPNASLSWIALALTPGLASRLSAKPLCEFGAPEEVFRAPRPRLCGKVLERGAIFSASPRGNPA